jgi:hypothetical protein
VKKPLVLNEIFCQSQGIISPFVAGNIQDVLGVTAALFRWSSDMLLALSGLDGVVLSLLYCSFIGDARTGVAARQW